MTTQFVPFRQLQELYCTGNLTVEKVRFHSQDLRTGKCLVWQQCPHNDIVDGPRIEIDSVLYYANPVEMLPIQLRESNPLNM